jgi:hypothetical protein
MLKERLIWKLSSSSSIRALSNSLPSVGMEHLDVKEVPFHRRKSLVHQIGVLVRTRAVSDDLTGTEVKKNADVRPFRANHDMRQIADNTGPWRLVVEIPVKKVGDIRFITLDSMDAVLLSGIGRHKPALFMIRPIFRREIVQPFRTILASVSADRIRDGSRHTQSEPLPPGRFRLLDRGIHNSRCFAQCPDTGTALIPRTCGHWP